MTALDDQPPLCATAPRDWWEWHEFSGGDGWAHLYRHSEITNRRLTLLLPWCLRGDRFPLEHDRPGISRRRVIPIPGRTCPTCANRDQHPRVGVPRARA